MAEKFGASLHVVHVMEDLLAHTSSAEVYVSSMPHLRDEIEKESRERLGGLMTDGSGDPPRRDGAPDGQPVPRDRPLRARTTSISS